MAEWLLQRKGIHCGVTAAMRLVYGYWWNVYVGGRVDWWRGGTVRAAMAMARCFGEAGAAGTAFALVRMV